MRRRQDAVVCPGTAAVAAAACLALVGRALDLPGAFPACCIAGMVGGLASARAPRLVITTATAAAVLWLAVALSGGRYDFYRFGAGDARLPVLNRDKRLVGMLSLGDLAVDAPAAGAGRILEDVSHRPGQSARPAAGPPQIARGRTGPPAS